ncbi:hypothetical protein AB0C02_28290 [Micromonospora sp. NPDC048999]|uniref:hypothetical protein n=1 Tax=Micromonospora sp. NPDC048999 TaxID=3155391 RepID=UPI003403A30B
MHSSFGKPAAILLIARRNALLSHFVRRLAALSAAALAVVAVTLVPATPAAAAPAIAWHNCESGAATYYCSVGYSGGVSPVYIDWYENGWLVQTGSNDLMNWCRVDSWLTVEVVVHDGTGSTRSSRYFRCQENWN